MFSPYLRNLCKTPPRLRKRGRSFSLSLWRPLHNPRGPRVFGRVLIPLLGERVRVRGLPRNQPGVTQRSPLGEGWGEGLPGNQPWGYAKVSPGGEAGSAYPPNPVRVSRAPSPRVMPRSLFREDPGVTRTGTELRQLPRQFSMCGKAAFRTPLLETLSFTGDFSLTRGRLPAPG